MSNKLQKQASQEEEMCHYLKKRRSILTTARSYLNEEKYKGMSSGKQSIEQGMKVLGQVVF